MSQGPSLSPHRVQKEMRPDGSILLTSGYALGGVAENTGAWLRDWAAKTPDHIFLAERSGAGWRTETYSSALQKVRAIAGSLLARGMGASTPILILSGNSIDHALLVLAAQFVGVPAVPVAEQYTLVEQAHGRLKYVSDLVQPALVFADNADAYAAGFAIAGCPAVASDPGATGAVPFADLTRASDAGVDAAAMAVGGETVAKILMTSGSTSDPKGVLTTQRMMTTNQTQLAQALPFLTERPPVLVDWLPWNHVFGGSHNFNMVLANGGSLYIDDGKPIPAKFGRTLENLGMVSGTVSFNVPMGFAQLVQALRGDKALRDTYFRNLDMIFYAGASLPQETWEALEDLAQEAGGQLPLITSSWGLTETAPAALLHHEPARGAGIVGVPLPGVEVKLIPDADDRCEVRLRGPSITSGYFGNATKTKEAFDDEGFFITGDAMRFVDAAEPARGLKFDGRLSEDFKLSTGTWVQAAGLRLDALAALAPLAADVVVTGIGRDEVGILIVPNRAAFDAQGIETTYDGGALLGDGLHAAIHGPLAEMAAGATGSAKRICRALVLGDPPDMAAGEATAKGNINFAKLLSLRADMVTRLYDNADPASIVVH